MKSALPLALVVSMAASALPVHAQDLRSSMQRAASQAAAQQRQRHRLMPKGFLWTGVGLLGYGGFLLALGEGYGPDHLDCPKGDCRVCTPDHQNCPRTRDLLRKGSRPFVASGAAVLAIGALIGATRSPDLAPRVTVNRRGFAIQQPVHLGRRHAHPQK
jgi:hypothetical protein